MALRTVFICSPYAPVSDNPQEAREERKENIIRAQVACRYALACGYLPYAPHLYFTQFLDDDENCERELGQLLGFEWLKECDELWIIGRRISSGMENEIEAAKKLDIPVRHYVFKRTPQERLLDAIEFPEIDFREMTI